MEEYSFSALPEELQNGLKEYKKLWDSGLKKKANEKLRSAMQYYDTLPAQIHNMFISIICNSICNNKRGILEHKHLPYEISVRLSKELSVYVKEGILPQALWYCELFGTLDDIIVVYQKNKDNLVIAEFLLSDLNEMLYFGSHHFPEFSCIERSDYDMSVNYGNEILKNHNINKGLQLEYEYYNKLFELFYCWDKQSDFSAFCREQGLTFEKINAYYYK